MTTTEFIKKSDDFDRNLVRGAFKIVSAYAGLTLIAEISGRVISNQIDAQGRKFPKYSTRPIFTTGKTDKGDHVWRKLAGSKTKRKQLQWRTINGHPMFLVPGGYAEIRRLSGELNIYKNFFFTGEMWKKFGIVASKLKKNGFMIRLGGKTPEAQRKIDENSKRERANIIDASEKEEKALAVYVDEWLQQEINKRFK